jgi:hypothetical protein
MNYSLLVHSLGRSFARNLKAVKPQDGKSSTNPVAATKQVFKAKKRKSTEPPNPKRVHTPEILQSKTRIGGRPLSPTLMKTCLKIFSKYKYKDIYDKGNVYMKLYTVLHASEKPADFSKIKVS